jgi:hypothetical protein
LSGEKVMEIEKFIDEGWEPGIVAGDEVLLEDIVGRYEVTVFTLAMHLVSDEELAKQVVIEVFIRYSREAHKHHQEPLDAVIHRFTYDAALPRLLGKLEQTLECTVQLGNQVEAARGAAEKSLLS